MRKIIFLNEMSDDIQAPNFRPNKDIESIEKRKEKILQKKTEEAMEKKKQDRLHMPTKRYDTIAERVEKKKQLRTNNRT